MQGQAANDDKMHNPFLDKSTDIAEVQKLRQDVKDVFDPSKLSKIPSIWSDAQILVMCVLTQPLWSRERIAAWLDSYTRWSREYESWVKGFSEVIHDYRSPVQVSPVRQAEFEGNRAPLVLTNVTAVRMLLYNVLHAEQDCVLHDEHDCVLHDEQDCVSTSEQDFFSVLPAELRAMVFDAVLVFPGCEVVMEMSDYPNSRSLCVRPRSNATTAELDENGHMRLCGDAIQNAYILRADLLAPLQVSKQFYTEAMPIFYAKNFFADRGAGPLYDFLRRTPLDRRNCIRHLTYAYDPENYRERHIAPRCFKLMKDMQSLRSLSINLHEPNDNLEWFTVNMPLWISDPPKVPGIFSLSRLRLEEVNIFGNCPKYRAFLAQMVKPKGKEAPKKPARKRKPKTLTAEADQGTGDSGTVVAQS